MRATLLSLALLLSALTWSFGQAVVEDFEGGAKLNWNPLQGSFQVVDNPPGGDTLNINPSAKVGAYTKQDGSAYSPLLAQVQTGFDLSVNNQVSIMIKAPKTGFFIFKLEDGPNQNAVEQRRYIAVKDQWIKYNFNFAAQANRTDLVKIVLFFDAGVDAGSDTYLFDNIVFSPCEGGPRNIEILDDFECNRNVTCGQPGYLDYTVVDNPDKSGINTSAKVAKYTDGAGPYHALVFDFGEAIALKDRNIVKFKVWAPKTGKLVAKLEGGSTSPVERGIDITETNKWVEYVWDFSDQENANHKKLVFFFNFAVDEPAGTIYYLDDLRLEAQPAAIALEDFEGGAKLTWESLGSVGSFGSFKGAVANPDKKDPNTSATVGSYTKGTSRFGGLKATLPVSFSLKDKPQLNLQVWAPADAKNITLQLFSAAQGLKSITQPLTGNQKWVDLAFNFEEFKDVADFQRVEILFDQDFQVNGSQWYFDNLTQSKSTVDPCKDVQPVAKIVDDFECQRKGTFGGGDIFEVVRNPDPRGINNSASDRVGKYTDPLDEYSALTWTLPQPFDLSIYDQLNVKIWSPKAVPLGFKLEGSATNNPIEIVKPATKTGEWVQYTIDFSAARGKGYTRLAIFMNFGQKPSERDVYYIDDVEWARAPYTACITDFETPETSLLTWRTFANGPDIDIQPRVANPDKSGINTSGFVGQFIEKPAGEIFAGMYTTNQEAPVALPNGVRTVRMKVWMSKAGRVVLKLERSRGGTPQTGDTFSETDYSTPGKWQELTWNFAPKNIPDGELWDLITVIPDFESKPDGADRVSYFDDITIGNSVCGKTTGLFSAEVARLSIYPNPAGQQLNVVNAEGVERFVIFNTLGQFMQTVQTTGQGNFSIDINTLQSGVYLLNAYDEQGRLRANAKFVKN